VFRNWSDGPAEAVAKMSANVIAFWDWRVGEIERQAPSDERDQDADGLGILIATPHLPPADTIRLGRRTVGLLRAKHRTGTLAWERLGDLARVDAAGTFEIVSILIDLELSSGQVYLPFDEVAPSLRAAIAARGLL